MSSPGAPSGCADALLARGRRAREREPEHEELVEREPRPPDLGLGERARAVDRDERIARGAGGAPRASSAAGRSSPDVADEVERLRVEVAELLLRDVLRRRVDGREVAGLRLAVEVVRGDGEAVAVRAAPEADARAGRELRLEPRLVEPRRLDLARLVGDPRGEDLQPPAAPARRRADDDLDDRLLVAEEVADPLRRHRLLVAPRPLPEEVVDRREAELREPARERRADAVQASRPMRRDAPAAAQTAAAASARARRGRRTRRQRVRAIVPIDRGHYRSGFARRRDAARSGLRSRDPDARSRTACATTRPSRRSRACRASPAASGTSPRRARRAACPRGGGRAPTSSPSGR